MGKRVQDDLDRRRGQPPRNGVHLSVRTRAFLAAHVEKIVNGLGSVAAALEDARHIRGDRHWRLECLTPEQRQDIKKATARVRSSAKKWVK